MALQVPERPVVRDDVEAVVGPLEGAAGTVAAVAAVADVGGEDRGAFAVPSRRTRAASSFSGSDEYG